MNKLLKPHYRPKSTGEIYRNMSAIRSTDNEAEMQLRRFLHSKGYRYRKYARSLPGRPDMVFIRERIAVFVDGDFWHARTLLEQGESVLRESLKTRNKDYWLVKFKKRVEKDVAVTTLLESEGWRVLRFWESDVRKHMPRVAKKVVRAIESRRREADL